MAPEQGHLLAHTLVRAGGEHDGQVVDLAERGVREDIRLHLQGGDIAGDLV